MRGKAACLLVALLVVPLLPAAAAAGEGAQVEVLDASVQHVVLKYTLADYETRPVAISGRTWTALSLHGEGFLTEVGSPQVPVICRSVEIPDAAAMQARVVSTRYHDVAGVHLAPSKGPIPRSIDPASVPFTFGPAYAQDAWYPAEPVSQRDPYVLRDVRGMVIEASLFQYNPVRKILRVHDELVVEVVPAGGLGENPIDRALSAPKPDRNFNALYSRHFLNHAAEKATSPPGDLLIICHGSFLTNMMPLVSWKNSIGVPTTMVDVATIGGTPAAIMAYITALYNASNLAYVLLVGDLAEIPTFTFAGGESDPTYSCITPDWYPDIFVGRFSAQTAAEVDTQVARTIESELEGHDVAMGDWNFRGMGIASNQGPGHYGELDNQHMGIIRNQLMAYGYKYVDQIYDPTGTKTMVFNGLNNGRRTINYCGHGGPTGWGTTGFSNSDVALLNNQGMLPTNHTVACSCGDFSYGACFGEAWLRCTSAGEAIGGVAAYMSSISQYWNEPMYGQACHLNGGKYAYVDFFCAETMDAIGALWFGGSCTMMDICGAAGRDMFMTWILFGDPSLCVIGQPLPDWAVKYGAGEVCSKGTVASIRHAGGFPSAGNPNFAVALTGGNTNQFAVLFSGDTQASTIYPWGELLVGPPNFLRTYAMTDYLGRATVNIPISAAMVGTSKCFQFAVRDKGFGGDVQASDGLQITFLP